MKILYYYTPFKLVIVKASYKVMIKAHDHIRSTICFNQFFLAFFLSQASKRLVTYLRQ